MGDRFYQLIPKPGGPFDAYMARKHAQHIETIAGYDVHVTKQSDTFFYNVVDMFGKDIVDNITDVPIGDYIYGKGVIHMMNVNIGRNIPLMEDGLKPVERRALYILYTMGCYGKHSEKVATVIGEMIKKVYPHGDQAPADTIYRLGRHFTMMIPYVQELGNYGNLQSMKPAAPRYAKAALTDYAKDCFFGDIGPKRALYDEKDNYSFSDKEPIYLVTRYPNILMQWNLGIGKGAMSWIGAFNSSDIFKATLALMDDPKAKIDIYPDTPVALDIVNRAELKGCFDMQEFKVKMRAPYRLETDQRRNGTKIEDKYTIVFDCLPIGVTGDQVQQEITDIKDKDGGGKKAKLLPEVINCEVIANDELPNGIEIIIEYERGYDPHVLAEKLYKLTSLAKSVGVKYNLVFDSQPISKTPREVILTWITQRYDQKRRYYQQIVLKAAKDRTIYEALVTVLGSEKITDEVIDIIRKSKNDDESVERLRKLCDFTDFQARTILEIKLKTLQSMDIERVKKSREEAIETYKKYRKLLSSDNSIKDAVRNELQEGLKKYGRPRKARLINLKGGNLGDPGEQKTVIYNGEYYFCVSDASGMESVSRFINSGYRMVTVRNSDSVLVFDGKGMLKILNGYAFNVNDTGVAMSTLGITDSPVVSIVPVKESYDSVAMITEKGYGKLMDMVEVTKSVKSRIITLNDGDRLADVVPIGSSSHTDSMLCMIQDDIIYYLHTYDFPRYKRSSAGNRMVKPVATGDDAKGVHIQRLVHLEATDEADYMLIFGESGYIKILDCNFLSFSGRRNNTISLNGKRILGAVSLHGSEDTMTLYTAMAKPYRFGIRIQIGPTVKFTLDTGEEHRFKMSTSIGSPTKVIKTQKTGWYAFVK